MSDWQPTIAEIVGRFARASNATLLARCDDDTLVVYKPVAGERPLWDFPAETLAAREALTYEVSEQLGLGVVPETLIADGPFGPGSVQRYVDIEEGFDPVPLIEEADPLLWPIAVLDLVCNNADRKVGHLIRDTASARILGIDHGLTFHSEDKLRTVLWGFSGEALPEFAIDALGRLAAALTGEFGARVEALLGRSSRFALTARVSGLVGNPVHPAPPLDRPAVPWPPY